jgi:glycosyltransferase involved in cell wall biosynthesis
VIFVEIDVVICTRNSEDILMQCLNSIFEEIPVCNLIVLDGFSTDKTLHIIDSYKDKFNIKLIQTKAALGKSREIGIKNVDTEWFAFIDSDVILRHGWFREINDYISDSKIGAPNYGYLFRHTDTSCFHRYNNRTGSNVIARPYGSRRLW